MHIIRQLYPNIQNIQNKFIITIKRKDYNMDDIDTLTENNIEILRYNPLSQNLANQISILIDVDDTRIEFYIPNYIMSFKQYIQGQKKDRNTYSMNTMKNLKSLDIFKVLLTLIDVNINIPQNTDEYVDPYYYNQYKYCQHNFTVSRDQFKASTTFDYDKFKNVIESQTIIEDTLDYIKGFLKLLVQRINEYYAEKSIMIKQQLSVLHKECQSIKNNPEFNAIGGHDVDSIIDSIKNYLTEDNDAAKNSEYAENNEGDKEVENSEYVENAEDIKDQRIPNQEVINREMLLHQWLFQNQEKINQSLLPNCEEQLNEEKLNKMDFNKKIYLLYLYIVQNQEEVNQLLFQDHGVLLNQLLLNQEIENIELLLFQVILQFPGKYGYQLNQEILNTMETTQIVKLHQWILQNQEVINQWLLQNYEILLNQDEFNLMKKQQINLLHKWELQNKEEIKPWICQFLQMYEALKNQKIETNQEVPNQEVPNQEVPNQEEPNQEVPNQEEPNQEVPNQEEPNQEVPNQEEPNQEEPNQEEPNQEVPNQEVPNQEVPNHLFLQNHEVLPEASINFGANVIPDKSFTLLRQPLTTAIPRQTVPLSGQPIALRRQTVPLSGQLLTSSIPRQIVPLLQPHTTALPVQPLTAISGQPLTTALPGQSFTAAFPGTNVNHEVNRVNEISEAIGNNRDINMNDQFDPYQIAQGDQFDFIQLLQNFQGDQNDKDFLNILTENNHLGGQFVENAGNVGNTSVIPEGIVNMNDQFHQNQIIQCYQPLEAIQNQYQQLPVAQYQQLPVAQYQQLPVAQCQQLPVAQCQQFGEVQNTGNSVEEKEKVNLGNPLFQMNGGMIQGLNQNFKSIRKSRFISVSFESKSESSKNEFRNVQYFSL